LCVSMIPMIPSEGCQKPQNKMADEIERLGICSTKAKPFSRHLPRPADGNDRGLWQPVVWRSQLPPLERSRASRPDAQLYQQVPVLWKSQQFTY
jgi:hypothetical protein